MNHIIFIVLKLILERKRQTFVSVAGVSIGVAAFIVMASLMNGFQKYFIEQAIDLNAHITIKVKPQTVPEKMIRRYFGNSVLAVVYGAKPEEKKDKITNYRFIISNYSKDPDFLGLAPHLIGQGIINYSTVSKSATVIGIDPVLERKASVIDKFITNKRLNNLITDRESIIVGRLLAKDLGIDELNKKVIITFPNGSKGIFKIVDFFESGITSLDQTRVYINIRTYQAMTEKPNEVNEIIVKLKDINKAERLAKKLQNQTGYYCESWQKAYRNFLQLFKIQNYITYMIVFAILVVSAFGIFNIIIMVVMEKRKDIAILMAMGYSRNDIIRIFTLQGVFNGFFGAIFGIIIGYAIQEYLSTIQIDVEGLVRAKGFILDRSFIYYIYGILFAFTFSLLASFYPSYRASRLNPVEIFRSG